MFKLEKGFTLVEILVALFVFSIVAVMMTNGLHRLLGVQARFNQQAQSLRDCQMAVLHLSRDIGLAVYRPITLSHGQMALAFRGQPDGLALTSAGSAGLQTELRHVEYHVEGHQLWREVWPVLDQAETSVSAKHVILTGIDEAGFEYLDKNGKFHQGWPLQADATQPLPRAVRLTLQLHDQGRLVQTWMVEAENSVTVMPHER